MRSLSSEKLLTLAFFEEGYDVHTNRDVVIPSVLERKSEAFLVLGIGALCLCLLAPGFQGIVLPMTLSVSFVVSVLLGKLWVYVSARPWFSMGWTALHCASHLTLFVWGMLLWRPSIPF